MKLNIFGKIYKVLVTKERPSDGAADVHHKDLLIRIHETKDKQYFDECLIHELVHATLYRIGARSTSLQSDFEETICDSIAKVISENFKLVKK